MSAVGEKIALGITDATLDKFIDTMGRLGVATIAANAAGSTLSTFYVRRGLDPEFASRWAVAKAMADEEVANALRNRSIDGVEEDVYHQGEVVGQKTKHSDSLLALLAKSAAPEYQESSKIVLSTPDDEKEVDPYANMTEEQLRRLVKAAGEAGIGDLGGA